MSKSTKIALGAAITAVVAFLLAWQVDLGNDTGGSDPTTTVTATPTTITTTVEPTTTEPTTTQAPTTTAAPSTTTTAQPVACPGVKHQQDGDDGMGGCWPGPLTTGVPEGTVLTPYAGPVYVDGPLVIDAKQIDSDIVVRSGEVKITNSRMNGHIISECDGCSAVIETSEIDGGTWQGTVVGYENLTVRKSELKGAWASVICTDCTIEDSYLWGQHAPAGVPTHNDAYYVGGGGNVTLRHNTLWCSAQTNDVDGGCSANLFLAGDFGQLDGYVIDRNLFPVTQGSYCASFGDEPGKPYPIARNVKVTDNVFQRGPNGKCALFGPVTSYRAGNGNVWAGNTWDNGGTVPPG